MKIIIALSFLVIAITSIEAIYMADRGIIDQL